MAEAVFRRQPHGLCPADPDAAEMLKTVPLGSLIRVKFKRSRNLQHHRLAFALLHMLFNNLEHKYGSFADFYLALKYRLGWYRVLETKAGPLPLVDSLSFADMTQDEFAKRYDQLVAFVRTEIWPKVGEGELRDMVASFMDQEAA